MRTVSRPRSLTILARTALVVGLSASLGACSGDETPSEAPASSATTSGDGGGGVDDPSSADGEAADLPQVRTCTVEVDVSGDVDASWKGKGDVRVRPDTESGPTARYSASDGDALVTVYSPDDAIDYPAVTFSAGKQAFTSVKDDASDISVERDGTSAEAQVELTGFDAATVVIDVAFTCTSDQTKGTSKGSAKNEG